MGKSIAGLALLAIVGCGAPGGDATTLRVQKAPPAPAAASAEASAAAQPTPIADRYRDTAAKIIAFAVKDERAYERLAYLTDRIGNRLSGSGSLDKAIRWAADTLRADGHENVHTEKVMVPHWVRGKESGAILAPIERELHLIGVGNTVGTPPRGITGQVVVVDSYEQLEKLGAAIKGKIVLYNNAMPAYDPEKGAGYGETVVFRNSGASRAAALGARAVLVRSVTAHSLQSPHTGTLRYAEGVAKIPAAAVTVEDAMLIARLARSGDPVKVRLTLGAKMLPDAESANVIAELRGRELPEEVVVIGAHIDSWDVGQGAHDDGTGCVIMMHALTVLRDLGLRPRRTIRVVLFTNEENGLRGAKAYAAAHADEDHVAVLESDSGGFRPRGFHVQENDVALAQMRDIVSLLAPLHADRAEPGFSGADVMPLTAAGMPGLGLWVDGSKYFDYHHTEADTFDKVDPEHLAQNVAAVAVVAYVLADMPARLGTAPASSEN